MPLYYAVAKDLSPIMSAVVLFPFTLMMGPASVVVSVVIAITGRYRPSLVCPPLPFHPFFITTLNQNFPLSKVQM